MNYDLVLNKEQILKRRKAVELKMKRITAFSAPFLTLNEIKVAPKLTDIFKQELMMKIAPEKLAHYYDFFDIQSKNLKIPIQKYVFFINKYQLIHLAELTNLFFCVSPEKHRSETNLFLEYNSFYEEHSRIYPSENKKSSKNNPELHC